MATNLVRTGLLEANGIQLYHEIRGDGPPVVFIAGGGGDGGAYESVAERLADAFTVVTYDRRGNSRSPKPDGWTSTSTTEQADDCAALIEALGLDRPAVFGSSLGGTILVGLVERYAHLLRGAVVHEPGLPSVSPSAPEFTQQMTEILTKELATGDAAKARERVGRWLFGDAAFDAIPADLRKRGDANQEVNLGIDSPGVMSFVPDEAAIATVEIPVHGVYGEETPHAFLVEGAQWVSKAFGSPLHALPGGHVAYIDRPAEFAQALGPIFDSMG